MSLEKLVSNCQPNRCYGCRLLGQGYDDVENLPLLPQEPGEPISHKRGLFIGLLELDLSYRK